MKKTWILLLFSVSCFLSATAPSFCAEPAKPSGPSDILIVSGTIANAQGKGVKEVGVHFFLNGQKIELKDEIATSREGNYKVEIALPTGSLPGAKVEMQADKPSYQESQQIALASIVKEKTDAQGNTYYLAHQNVTIKRAVSPAFWIATLVLIAVYALIAFELMHRTLAALLGAALLHVHHLYRRDLQLRLHHPHL